MLTVDDELDNDIAEPTKPDADGFRLLLLLLLLIQILNLLVKNGIDEGTYEDVNCVSVCVGVS
ncbi:unnamed protein product, partial [Rotaria magnacalcarata]